MGFILEASASLLVIAIYKDGIRAPMVPFILTQIISTIIAIIGFFKDGRDNYAKMIKSYPAIGLTALGLGSSLYLVNLVGLGDFRRVHLLGKYKVGYKEFHTKKN